MLATLIIDSLLLTCPCAELPLLDTNARMDMLDYYAAGMEARGVNRYGGTSLITKKEDDLLTIKLTDVSTWTLRLVETRKGTIAECTHTLEIPDLPLRSTTHYYRTDWTPVKKKPHLHIEK